MIRNPVLRNLRRIPVSLSLVLAIGASLRLWQLGAKSLWFDEAFTVGVVRSTWPDMVQHLIAQSNMTLYYLLLRGWVLFGDSEWWLRFFTVIFALASMVLFAAFAKRYFGNAVALISTALVAVFPLHVHYSRDVRSYGMLLVTLAASWWLWTDAMLHDRKRSYVGWVLFALAALYSHIFACFIFGAQIVAVPLLPDWRARVDKVARAAACYALGGVPLAYCACHTGAQQITWIAYSSTNGFSAFVAEVTGGQWFLLVLALAVFAVGAVCLVREIVKNGRSEATFLSGAVFAAVAIPVITILTLSLWKPCLLPRYVLMVVPYLAIALGWTLVRVPRWASGVTLCLLITLSGLGTRAYFKDPVWNDFRSATFLIANRAEPNDALVACGNEMRPGVDYYRDRRPKGTNFPAYIFPGTSERMGIADYWSRPTAAEYDESLRRYDHVWLLLERDTPVPKMSIWQHFFLRRLAAGFNLVGNYHFEGLQVFEFRREIPHNVLGPAHLNQGSLNLLNLINPRRSRS